MHKFVVTLMTSLLGSSAVFAFWPEATDSSLEVGVGYRQDRIEWKTSANLDESYSGSYYGSYYGSSYSGGSYNDYEDVDLYVPTGISSHLKWKNLSIWQIEAKGKYVTCDNLYLRANADYGWVTSGKNTDADYISLGLDDDAYSYYSDYYYSGSSYSNYGEEFARSKSKVSGQVYDVKIAVGYQFKWCDDSFAISPLVGYSWHGQHLKDKHLEQEYYTLADDVDTTSARSYYSDYSYSDYSYSSGSYYYSYGGEHSSYHTRWNGPFVGFDFDYRFGCGCEAEWELFGTYEFHWATFNAKGHWNLREDLPEGFNQHANTAYGNVFDIGIKWDFCECWTLALKGEFQWWWADHGHDSAKIAHESVGNVQADCRVKQPLHDVRWDSASISLDIGMVF